MEIPSPVEPRLVDLTRHVDDQRVPFPAADRMPHPRIAGIWVDLSQMDGASGVRKLEDHLDLIRALNNLKWIGQIHRARHAR